MQFGPLARVSINDICAVVPEAPTRANRPLPALLLPAVSASKDAAALAGADATDDAEDQTFLWL